MENISLHLLFRCTSMAYCLRWIEPDKKFEIDLRSILFLPVKETMASRSVYNLL